ncbi:MAG: hypothetical protein ACK56F_32915, partial [bacterium]
LLLLTINNKLIKNQKLSQVINIVKVEKTMLLRMKHQKKNKRKKMKIQMKRIVHAAVNVVSVQLDQ